MQTISFYFNNDEGAKLFGEIDLPNEGASRNIGIVICYPIAEERIRSHRVIYNLAKKLQSEGYAVLRFDYWGQGDSEGEWEEASIDSRLSDIKHAINTLKEKSGVNDIGLLGLRFGATLANIVASVNKEIKYLIMLDPTLSPGEYLYDSLRSNLASQVMVHKKIVHNRDQMVEKIKNGELINVDGFEIAKPLFEQANNIDLLNTHYDITAKILVMEIKEREEKPSNKKLQEYVDKLTRENKNVTFLTSISEKFWALLNNYYPVSVDINTKTLEWLNKMILGYK